MSDHRHGILFWITGLSGAGKTTVGRELYQLLRSEKQGVVFLDGDQLREVFTPANDYGVQERLRLALLYARLCKMLTDQGLDVVCATISLFKECHQWNRKYIKNYREIYFRVPIAILQQRDSKKIYSRASNREITQVMGIDMPFEEPENPDIIIENTGTESPGVIAKRIYEKFA